MYTGELKNIEKMISLSKGRNLIEVSGGIIPPLKLRGGKGEL